MKKKFKLRHIEKVVSVFIFLAIFLLSSMIVFLAKQKKLFAKKRKFYTIINSLEKISTGQEIILKGPNIPIGKITNFSITNNNRVKVEFFIYEEFEDKVRTDSVVIFNAPLFGFLGGFKVELTNGDKYYPKVEDNELIPSNQMHEGIFLLSVMGISKDKKELPIIDKLNPVLDNVAKLLNPQGQLMRNTTNLLFNLNSFAKQLNEGGVFRVLGSSSIRSNLERLLYQLNTLIASSDNLMNKNVKRVLVNITSLLNGLKKVTGTVNYNLPKMMNEVNRIMFRVQRMMKSLESSPIFSGGKLRKNRYGGRKNMFEGR